MSNPDGGSKRKYRCRILPLRPLRDGDDDGVRALRGDARALRGDVHVLHDDDHALLRGDDVRALLFSSSSVAGFSIRESILPR